MRKQLIYLTLILIILLTLPFMANAQEDRLTIVSGNGQKGEVGTALANPFTVKYETRPSSNDDWVAGAGKTIYFRKMLGQSVSSTGSLASSATTDANGEASVTLTLGTRKGKYVIAALTGPNFGGSTKSVQFSAQAFIIELTIVSGQSQSDTVGRTLANPFVVELRDSVGELWSGQTVKFSVFRTPTGSTGASISETTATTGTNGRASTTLTLGDTAGDYRVLAEFTKPDTTVLWVRFDAKAEAQVATKLEKRSVDGQSVTGGTKLSTAFIVRVLDQDDAAMSGVSVSFSVSPSSGSVNRSTMTTGSNGQASTVLTVGTAAGTYTVTASVTKADGTKLTVTFTATVPQIITTLQKHSGDGQSAQVGTQLSTPLTVKVLDQGGAAMSGVSVSFSVSPSGTLTGTTVSTSTNGLAFVALTLGNSAGTYTVTASVTKPDNTKLTETFTATAEAVPQVITGLEKRFGDGQSAQVGTQLTSAFIVRVVDQNGLPISDVSVSFSVSPSSGSVNRSTMTTGSNGQASTVLTVGSTTGTYTVTASVTKADNTKLTVEFTATATAEPPPPVTKVATTLEKVSGDGQSAQVNTRLSSPFVVRVLDQNGAAMSGVSVSFSVSPSGTLSASTPTTGANGQASTTLTLGSGTGTYTVTASVQGITNTVSFTATGEAAPPPPPPEKIATTLEYVSGNGQSGQVNTQLNSAFVVRVLDQNGAALGGVSVAFSVSPSGTLSASTPTTGANGQASTTLTLGSGTGTYTVTASVQGITNTVSFTATGEAAPPPPPPEKIATTLESVSGNGQSGQVNTQLSSAFVVRVLDQNGAALGGVSVAFSVSPSGSLSASTATTNTQGQASTVLTLGSATGTYTVTASVAGITGTVSFTATAEAVPPPPPVTKVATTLEKVSGDGQSAQVSTQLSNAFVVRVLDQDGAALSGVSVAFSVSPSSGGLSASTATTNPQGQASTVLTLGSTTGTYTVTASVAGITGTVSFTATAEAAPPPPPPNTGTGEEPSPSPPERIATTLEKYSGDGQSAQVNTQLSNAFVVRVLDQNGAAMSGVSVSFSVSPSGSLSATTATTGTNGQASTTLTLGSATGTYTVTASVAGITSSVSFTATGEAPVQQPAPDLEPEPTYPDLVISSTRVSKSTLSPGESFTLTTTVVNNGNAQADATTLRYYRSTDNNISSSDTQVGTDSISALGSGLTSEASIGLSAPTLPGTYYYGVCVDTVNSESDQNNNCGSPIVITVETQPASLVISSGNNQKGVQNSELTDPLVVQVLDDSGNGVANVEVTFRIRTGKGRLSSRSDGRSVSVTTNSQGFAEVPFTPTDAGSITILASVVGLDPVTFTVDAGLPPAKLVKVSGDNQQSKPNQTLASPFVVEVQDKDDNPVADITVTFSVTAGGGSLSATTVKTGADGIAQTVLTLGSKIVVNSVSASVTGVDTSVTFNASIEPTVLIAANKRPAMCWVDLKQGTLHRLAGAEVENLLPSVKNATSLAVDMANGMLYWAEQTGKKSGRIRASNSDGTNIILIKEWRHSVPYNLFLDAAAGKLYFSNSQGKVRRINVDGTNQENIVTGVENLNHTAIDVMGSKLYWAEQTGKMSGRIRAANLDGTNITTLKTINAVPYSIAVDSLRGKLYFTNSRGKVSRLNVDGKGFQSNLITGLNEPIGITVDMMNSKIYWTEQSTLRRADLAGKNIQDVVIGSIRPNGIAFDVMPNMETLPAAPSIVDSTRRETALLPNYPNPFNPETWIPYQLASPGDVSISIYAADGQVVRTLQLGNMPAGNYISQNRAAYWDGRNATGERVASGVYFYTLTTEQFSATRKMLILK